MGGFGVTNCLATGLNMNFSPSHRQVKEGTSLVSLRARQWRHGLPYSQYSLREVEVVCCGCATAGTTAVLNLKTEEVTVIPAWDGSQPLTPQKMYFSLILAGWTKWQGILISARFLSECMLAFSVVVFLEYSASWITADNLLSLEVHSSIHLNYFITRDRLLTLF